MEVLEHQDQRPFLTALDGELPERFEHLILDRLGIDQGWRAGGVLDLQRVEKHPDVLLRIHLDLAEA